MVAAIAAAKHLTGRARLLAPCGSGCGIPATRRTCRLCSSVARPFLFASAQLALLPWLARQELGGGPKVYGFLLACIGGGAVGGALWLPRLRARLSRDPLVAGATIFYAGATLALAYIRNVYWLGGVMLISGAAWITVVSSLMVAAQTALPAWVRARGLAMFMVVFMGGMAGGSALWGQLATDAGIPVALTAAAVGTLLALAATWMFRLGGHDDSDLAPSMHWPTPPVTTEPGGGARTGHGND